MINAAAIKTLPQPLRSYFQSHQLYLVSHASDPDLLAEHDPGEERHHFADIEAYDASPFRRFHRQFVTEHLPPTPLQIKDGDAMWQIDGFTMRLASDFRARQWGAASHDAVFAAHYAADLTQPLHTVGNFDGQLTGQNGIHQRFETGVVKYYMDQWRLDPRPATLLTNLREAIFEEFFRSYQASGLIFGADRHARAHYRPGSRQFFADFARLTGPLAETRIKDAASFVGSLWYTAWVRAGRPDLRAWKSAAVTPGWP